MSIDILGQAASDSACKFPLLFCPVPAGFPSPADDFIEMDLDLNRYLVSHPSATFFIRVRGDSMINAGIYPNDILIVDTSLEAKHRNIVIAVLNGEMTVKRLLKKDSHIALMPENPAYSIIRIQPETDFSIWGVVCHVIHRV